MPRKPSGLFDQKEYVKKYTQENLMTKKTFFNKNNDQKMIEWIKGRNFSGYVKSLIRRDMGETLSLSDDEYVFTRTPRQLANENTLESLRQHAGWIDLEKLGDIYGSTSPEELADCVVSEDDCKQMIADWYSEREKPGVRDLRYALQIQTALYIAENAENANN